MWGVSGQVQAVLLAIAFALTSTPPKLWMPSSWSRELESSRTRLLLVSAVMDDHSKCQALHVVAPNV
jgi:hypothetical protein